MGRTDFPDQLSGLEPKEVRLVFDTAAHGMTAGTRLRETSGRHLLFEVAELCLDLRYDHPPRSATAVVIGQLADRRDPLSPLRGLPVFLVVGKRILARTTSNRMGEFRLEFPPEDGMRVCLDCGNQELIEVPVNPAVEDSSGSE